MIAVMWEGGQEPGFSSRSAAEMYIEKVCKKIAPEKTFSIQETHPA